MNELTQNITTTFFPSFFFYLKIHANKEKHECFKYKILPELA